MCVPARRHMCSGGTPASEHPAVKPSVLSLSSMYHWPRVMQGAMRKIQVGRLWHGRRFGRVGVARRSDWTGVLINSSSVSQVTFRTLPTCDH